MQRVEGVNWSEESYFKNRLILTKGDLDGLTDKQAIILSSFTAEKLGVEVGETLLARLQTVTGQQNVGEFKVIAVVQSSNMSVNMASYTNIDYLNELINLKSGEFQSYNIFLNDMDEIDAQGDILYNAISEKAPVVPRGDDAAQNTEDEAENQERQMRTMFNMMSGSSVDEEPWEGTKYSVMTLNDMMAEVMAAVDVLNIIGLVVFIILIVIIMVGITNTFRMILVERTQEIGTIRAIGMQRGGVRNTILFESLFISLCGTLAGLILSVILSRILSLYSFGTNNPLFIFLNNGRLTFDLVPVSIIFNIIIIAATSLLAAYFPAKKASMLDPAKAIGTHY
jgi:putative ABC transport system permease protein